MSVSTVNWVLSTDDSPSHQPSVLFLTKYARNGASSRYRTFQYLPWLEQAGIDCQVQPLFDVGIKPFPDEPCHRKCGSG